MKIVPIQECRSADGLQSVKVPSQSDPRTEYLVIAPPWNPINEYACTCEGYFFRGHCKHQQIASDMLCRWRQVEGPEDQSNKQRRRKICPRCGGPTRWTMEEIDDQESVE